MRTLGCVKRIIVYAKGRRLRRIGSIMGPMGEIYNVEKRRVTGGNKHISPFYYICMISRIKQISLKMYKYHKELIINRPTLYGVI